MDLQEKNFSTISRGFEYTKMHLCVFTSLVVIKKIKISVSTNQTHLIANVHLY